MAELFDRDRTVISQHVNNCFKEGELDKSLVCANLHIPRNIVLAMTLNCAQQLFYKRTTAERQAHNSCCATAYQLLCASRY